MIEITQFLGKVATPASSSKGDAADVHLLVIHRCHEHPRRERCLHELGYMGWREGSQLMLLIFEEADAGAVLSTWGVTVDAHGRHFNCTGEWRVPRDMAISAFMSGQVANGSKAGVRVMDLPQGHADWAKEFASTNH